MPENKNLVQCYNRGCGQLFDPKNNNEDVCCHHPGAPVFHDAYKGWSCCNKKSVDFTEFLNIKGCTVSKHSNVKPPEPEKKALDKELEKKEVIEVRSPVVAQRLQRPPFDTPLVLLSPKIADSLKDLVQKTEHKVASGNDGNVPIGTACKNGGCSTTYEGSHTDETVCTYHSGCPIFHEGLKFWSCCLRKTTDFNTFLSQPGCTSGSHKWIKESSTSGTVKCRWDWHQTPEFVIVSVYAKKYDPTLSYIKLNPIRLNTKLVFREEGDAVFELDLELRGIVKVESCSASMLQTKVEIKLKKAEPGSWSQLDFTKTAPTKEVEKPKQTEPEDDSVDLSTVEAIHSMGKVNMTD